MNKVCEYCGNTYEAKTNRSKYCSKKCKTKHYREVNKILKSCKYCGKDFYDTSINHELQFCSTSCSSKYMHSKMESKVVICPICNKGVITKSNAKIVYCETCFKKVAVENTQRYLVNKNKLKKDNIGVGSGNAQGKGRYSVFYKSGIGIYRDIFYSSNPIIECSVCKSKENLVVHHIDTNRKNNNLDNLQLLCKSCHKKLHDNIKLSTKNLAQIGKSLTGKADANSEPEGNSNITTV